MLYLYITTNVSSLKTYLPQLSFSREKIKINLIFRQEKKAVVLHFCARYYVKLGLHDTWILMSLFKAGKQILLAILALRHYQYHSIFGLIFILFNYSENYVDTCF